MRQLTLSMKQPWALLAVLGIKRNETRSWHTKIRGPVRIYATQSWTWQQIDITCQLIKDFNLPDEYGDPLWELGHKQSLFGSVIGDVFFDQCISTNVTELVDRLSPMERAMGNYDPDRYFITLTRPNFYREPQPVTSQRPGQRFWYWEDRDADYTLR